MKTFCHSCCGEAEKTKKYIYIKNTPCGLDTRNVYIQLNDNIRRVKREKDHRTFSFIRLTYV